MFAEVQKSLQRKIFSTPSPPPFKKIMARPLILLTFPRIVAVLFMYAVLLPLDIVLD